MLVRVQCVSVRRVGVMGGLLVVACFGMFRRITMVLRGMFMMLRGHFVMFVNIVTAHRWLPCCRLR